MFTTTALIALVASTFVQAAPAWNGHGFSTRACSLSKATLPLPSGQTTLKAASNPEYITLGVGVQNYTCSSTGTYTSIGAFAALYDISCLYNTPFFNNIQDVVYQLPASPEASDVASKISSLFSQFLPKPIIHHFFVPNPAVNGTGVSPRFNLDGSGLNPSAYVTTKKLANLASPSGPSDVDWLQLANVQGTLAQSVYRVDTKGGQPPVSCTPGSSKDVYIKYTAKYWFFK